MRLKLLLSIGLLALSGYFHCSNAITEEIESTPSNSNGFEWGELTMPQMLFLMLIFLKLVLLYAMGILPLEIDLGGLLDPSTSIAPQVTDSDSRSLTTYFRLYDAAPAKSSHLKQVFFDCPLQYVCEIDHWANREHDTFFEDMVARWLRSNSSNPFSSSRSRVFAGLPDTCPEMYPCPLDIQDVVGFRIPGSKPFRTPSNDLEDTHEFIRL